MKKLIVITILLLLNYTALFSEPSVGSLQGIFEVDLSGAATYTVPLFIPPGTNGMQPSISMVYSSMAGEGVMGMG